MKAYVCNYYRIHTAESRYSPARVNFWPSLQARKSLTTLFSQPVITTSPKRLT